MTRLHCSLILLALCLPTIVLGQTVPEGFSVETIHSQPGTKALGFALLPDERILTISHQNGEINLVADGVLSEEPVAMITNYKTSNEQGLLGIAVDPDFPEENYIYLYYTTTSGTNRISKFAANGALNDPASLDFEIDVSSEQILLDIEDDTRFHNAGTLRFGSDKTLYISHGDDARHTPTEVGYLQDLRNLYGKILRINRDGTVPPDNPTFPSEPEDMMPEIFAVGLRNPFRFSIDPRTDVLFIGDVGTNLREELNLSSGGENFGYPKHEGYGFFREESPIIDPEPTFPIYAYEYGSNQRSAIALATYRPVNFPDDNSFPPEFDGVHFYTDYFDDELYYLRPAEDGGWESVAFGTGFASATDGAVGPDGSLYVIRYNGPLQRIVYTPTGSSREELPQASALEIHPNYPNPFDDRTVVSYHLPGAAHVSVAVYDVLGRRVATLVDEWQTAGEQSVGLGAAHLPSGAYLCRIQAGSRTAVRTIVKR